MTGLKLKPPEPLPQKGVTSIAFKCWKNSLEAFLGQDVSNHLFFNDGCYSAWTPYGQGKRIARLHAVNDPENVKLERIEDATEKNDKKNELLVLRNAQLMKFVQHIANFTYFTEQDDIIRCSKSLQWIYDYLKTRYDIQSRGVHFLKIAHIQPDSGTCPQSYYKELRAGFLDNLRKAGDFVKSKNQNLDEDEELSATLYSGPSWP